MKLFGATPVIEGQFVDVCVVIESANTQVIDIVVNVTVEISSIEAGTYTVTM